MIRIGFGWPAARGTAFAELCRKEGISQGVYYKMVQRLKWRPVRSVGPDDIVRQANTSEVKSLRPEARNMKEVYR